MKRQTQGSCTICLKYTPTLHWHHTVPQALGGVDSLQIPLCGDCHTVLHAYGSALCAKIKNGRPIVKDYWSCPSDAKRAEPWIQILVEAMLNPPIRAEDKTYKLCVDVDHGTRQGLGQLSELLGKQATLSDTVLYCIAFTLNTRGINNGQHQHRTGKRPQEGTRVVKKPKADLW